jgi:hypothetical protein
MGIYTERKGEFTKGKSEYIERAEEKRLNYFKVEFKEKGESKWRQGGGDYVEVVSKKSRVGY